MKIRSTLFVGAALLCSSTVSQADVTNVVYADDGDGVLVCPVYTYPGGNVIQITGDHRIWDSGHVLGTIYTSEAIDPTLTMMNAINNDTGFAWTGYIVDVFMTQSFSLSFPSPAVSAPPGWTAAITVAPYNTGTNYAGQITYTGGTPVSPIAGDPNNILQFGYNLTFSNAMQYGFCQQVTPVPEPAAASLIIGGLLAGVIGFRRRAAR